MGPILLGQHGVSSCVGLSAKSHVDEVVLVVWRWVVVVVVVVGWRGLW